MNTIIIPNIRRIYPKLIASSLVGVQPMTPPSKGFISNVKMSKVHYRHFSRVYNRRNIHPSSYLNSLGYLSCSYNTYSRDEIENWCKKIFKPGSYVFSYSKIWFAYEKDYTLFSLRWS